MGGRGQEPNGDPGGGASESAARAPEPAERAPEPAERAREPADPAPGAPEPVARQELAERRAVARVSRRAPIVAGAVAVGLALLLGLLVVVREGVLAEVDEEWAEEVLTIRGPVGDVIALFMNWLGGGIVGVFVVPIVAAVVLLVLRRPWGAAYFIAASALSALVVQLLKSLFGRARPEDMLVTSDYGSFPSGHVANAATIAVVVGILALSAWVWAAGAAYTVLMAISRTYLGVHWITDTLGGVLVGAGAALLAWAALAVPLERERMTRRTEAAERNAARAQAHVTPPARARRPSN